MKLLATIDDRGQVASPPPTGAWIETPKTRNTPTVCLSPPPTGAWIETSMSLL